MEGGEEGRTGNSGGNSPFIFGLYFFFFLILLTLNTRINFLKGAPHNLLIRTILAVAGNLCRCPFHSFPGSFAQVFAPSSQRNPSTESAGGEVQPAPSARRPHRARPGRGPHPTPGRSDRELRVLLRGRSLWGEAPRPPQRRAQPAGSPHLQRAARLARHLCNLTARFLQIKGRGLTFAFAGGT